MKVSPTPSWELTNEHATSAYAVPVLVDRHEGRAYGRGGKYSHQIRAGSR